MGQSWDFMENSVLNGDHPKLPNFRDVCLSETFGNLFGQRLIPCNSKFAF